MSCKAPPRQLPLLDTRPIGAPMTRGECDDVPRPCRYTTCRYHLWRVDGEDRPGRRWGDADERLARVVEHTRVSCALDVADAEPDGVSATKIGELLGVDTRRAEQLVDMALRKLKQRLVAAG